MVHLLHRLYGVDAPDFANDRDFLEIKKLHAYIRTYEDYKLLTN